MAKDENGETLPKLEFYSQKFRQRLLREFPLWKRYAGHYEKGEPDDLTFYLDVQVPSANPRVSEPLKITTYPQEVIISWLMGNHRHFDPSFYRANDYQEQAIQFLKDIVADKVIFGYYKDHGSAGGFWHMAGSENPDRGVSKKFGDIIRRSWLGGHDSDETV